MNKKGFVLMETLVVTIFAVFIFTVLYNSIVPLLGRYEELAYYDDLDTTYDLYYLRNFIENDSNYNEIKSNKYLKLTCDNLQNKDDCNTLFEFLEIDSNTTIGTDEVIFLNTNYLNEFQNDENISIDVKNYLKYKKVEGNILLLQKDGYISYIKKINASDKIKSVVNSKQTNKCKTYIEEDGIIYISGSKECIDFNYVWYSGKLWRITALYPDGRIKMITDDMITSIAYGSDNVFYTDENTNSYVYQWLNQDFLDTLVNSENIIVEDEIWNASPGNGTVSNKLPIEGQEETLVKATVGLLNSYEYYKSYQNLGDNNYAKGYLNINFYWWLLNSYSQSSSDIWFISPHVLDTWSGYADSLSPVNSFGIRPSITLKSTIKLNSGDGTIDNPYRIKGDKEEVVANTTLLNTRSSGEYVILHDELFRIIGTEVINENLTTKLNKVDYIRNESNIIMKKFASSVSFGKDTNTKTDDFWDYYLNNTWLKEFDSTYNETDQTSDLLDKGKYYIKTFTNGNYKGTICQTVNNNVTTKSCEKVTSIWNGYIGLPRYGEMFASQSGSNFLSLERIWLISPSSSSNIWNIRNDNYSNDGSTYSINSPAAVRPTINLKSNIVIKSGSGMLNDPFVVGLA